MKKSLSMIRGEAALLCLAVFIGSCREQKESVAPLNPVAEYTAQTIIKEPFATRAAYVQYHLTALAVGIAQLASDPEFRQLVYQEADQEKYGENSALLYHLYRKAPEIGIDMIGTLKNAAGKQDFSQSAKAFWGINGKVLYPQILIPFYTEHRSGGISARSSKDKPPIIVIYNGEEGKKTFPGYLSS